MGDECAGCGAELSGDVTTALGKKWHPDCFCCQFCNKGFPDGSFVVHEGFPYHDECHDEKFADRCTMCGKVLKGTFVQACGGLYHNECFVCAGCGKSLEKGFVAGDGKPFCSGACSRKAKSAPAQTAAKYEKQAEVDAAVQAALASSATAKLAAAEEAANPRAAVRAELFGNRKQQAGEFSRELAERPDIKDLDSEGEEEMKPSIQAELAGMQAGLGDRQRLDAAATASQAPESKADARFNRVEAAAAKREAEAKAPVETLFNRMESHSDAAADAQLAGEVDALALQEAQALIDETEWYYLGADGERQAPPLPHPAPAPSSPPCAHPRRPVSSAAGAAEHRAAPGYVQRGQHRPRLRGVVAAARRLAAHPRGARPDAHLRARMTGGVSPSPRATSALESTPHA